MRSLIIVFILSLSGLSLSTQAEEVSVTETTDLYSDAKLAAKRQLPIMVFYSAEHCGYCGALEASFIKPMIKSGEYENKVIIRKVMIDGWGEIRRFDGDRVEAHRFATRNRIWVTPTVAFYDPNGNEVAEKLIGFTTPELYGGYLDDAIDTSLNKVRSEQRQASKHAPRLSSQL